MNKALVSLFCLLILSGCGSFSHREPCPTYHTVQPKKRKQLIIVDAGHGGADNGKEVKGPPSYQEKSFTLSTAFMLKRFLKQQGYSVILTRTEDVFVPLKERAALANQHQADLFVSVHYNAAPSKEAHGVEVFFYQSKEDLKRSKRSKDLAEHVFCHILEETGAKARRVKHGNFAVIRETTMPAILVEGGFMSNAMEMEKIKDARYMKKVAWGIAQGVESYFDCKTP